MKETYELTRGRIIRKNRCRCQWPKPWEVTVLTTEEVVQLARERGRIAAGAALAGEEE